MNYVECILSISQEAIETIIFEDHPRELIRCRYWDRENKGFCNCNHIFTVPDWFCADGDKTGKNK